MTKEAEDFAKCFPHDYILNEKKEKNSEIA